MLDEIVNGFTGLNEKHHSSWFFEFGNEILDAAGTNDGLSLCLVLKKTVNLGHCSVESNNSEAVISHVENEILAHNGQANKAEISPDTSLVNIP
jgi:hypothetical protein